MAPTALLLAACVAACVAAAGAIFFDGDSFEEKWACEVEGQVLGVCEEQCKDGAPGGEPCGVAGRDLRCCPAAAPDAADLERGRRLREKCRQFSKPGSCEDFRPFNGSNEVVQGEYPYTAALGYRFQNGKAMFLCAGVLISEDFVLTTAVCAKGTRNSGPPGIVRLGDLHLKDASDDAHVQEVQVQEAIVHPDYATATRGGNDIGLLRLASKVRTTDAVRPACLHAERALPADVASVAGYGRTHIGGVTELLRKADLPIYKGDCKEAYKNHAEIDEEKTICAGSHLKDTCTGDSGVGLAVKLSSPYCVHSVIGISSFGPSNCGTDKLPGVFTRLYPYLPWIENLVWPA